MLTRLSFHRDLRVLARYMSDKPSDNNGKAPGHKSEAPIKNKTSSDASKEKIQELLKAMMMAPKTGVNEEFTVAPERPKKRKQKTDEINVKTEQIEEQITKAAGDVAQAFGGNIKQTEAELLSKVLGKINQTSTSLSDLIIGMKVDYSKDTDSASKRETRGQQVKRLVNKSQSNSQNTRFAQRQRHKSEGQPRPRTGLPQSTIVDIFTAQPLGIFTAKVGSEGTKLEVWESLKERELSLATSQPPANYFQKMIQWTEQGKVWKFPVDNEQGLEEEQNINFSEHIFLDTHLEGWCPKKGPIRHFMELVCVGLSKNAFYTAQEKKDHIMWYKEYFESKKDVLNELGAWEVKSASNEVAT